MFLCAWQNNLARKHCTKKSAGHVENNLFFHLVFFFKQQILHKVFRLLKCSPAAAPKPTERLATTTTDDDDMRKKTLLTSVDYQVSEQLPDWFKCSASATPSDSRKKKKKKSNKRKD